MIFPHRILFVRHGETAFNAEGRLQGQRDVPLNPRGRAQASAVGKTLRASLGPELNRLDAAGAFVASPLMRTRETMEIMRAGMALDPERYRTDPVLMELGFGVWEGCTWTEAAARDAKAVRARFADKWNYVPSGGESYAMLAARVQPWAAALTAETLVVSHGGVARVLMTMAGEDEAVASEAAVIQGRALVFEGDGWRYLDG